MITGRPFSCHGVEDIVKIEGHVEARLPQSGKLDLCGLEARKKRLSLTLGQLVETILFDGFKAKRGTRNLHVCVQ